MAVGDEEEMLEENLDVDVEQMYNNDRAAKINNVKTSNPMFHMGPDGQPSPQSLSSTISSKRKQKPKRKTANN